jgi:glutaminase
MSLNLPPRLARLALAAALVALAATTADARGRPDPTPAELNAAVQEAYTAFKDVKDGANADYIPELAKVPSELFGVAIVTVDGQVYAAGDVDYAFSIQSVSKPFTAALVMEELGADAIKEKIGVEPTGQRFNSIMAIEQIQTRAVNPLVNAGAIAAVSLVPAKSPKEKFGKIIRWHEAMAGGVDLPVLMDVYASEAASNERNQSIAWLLKAHERFYDDPAGTVDVYTKQCSIGVTAKQLAMMGATLANGGVNPATGKRVMKEENVPRLLAVMTMAGFYDEAGRWAWDAGLAGKTGVGGGIVAVVPGKMAIVGFSPRLNKAGNSVRAMKAIEHISAKFGLSMFEAR